MEADAEARCTEYLDLALRVDAGADINPEIYITLASVRLSQCRPEDALGSLTRSFSIWKDEPPTSPSIPTFVARLNLARLFVECEAYAEAIEVLEGLEDEDDEEFEVLYLLGLANWLIGEKATEEAERREAYIDSREVLERLLQVSDCTGLIERACGGSGLTAFWRTRLADTAAQTERVRSGHGGAGEGAGRYAGEDQKDHDEGRRGAGRADGRGGSSGPVSEGWDWRCGRGWVGRRGR